MITILITIFFVFGLIIGSFLNVVIVRFNTQKSFGGRSACMSCQRQLRWYDLIPVISFVALRGRCRTCQSRISSTYPIVEFLTALIFTTLFLKFQNIFFADFIIFIFTYAFFASVFSLLLVTAVYDLRHKIIPDVFSWAIGILGFLGLFFFNSYGFYPHMPTIMEFLAGPLVAAPFAIFWLISSGTWMGLGDAKLAVGLGWILGLSRAISGFVVAFWIGAIVGLLLVLFSKKHGMKSEIPFAPYLVLGTMLAFLFELHIF